VVCLDQNYDYIYTYIYMPLNHLENLAKNRKEGARAREEKIAIYIKLAPSVLSYFKSEGRGYQARINELLTEYVALVQASKAENLNGGSRSNSLRSPSPLPHSLLSDDERIQKAQQLFNKFYAQCFWHLRSDLEVTEALLPLVAEGLRRHGGREGFLEAKQLCQ
jgi:hypothetical protein